MLSSIFLLNRSGEVVAQMNFSEAVSWRDLTRFYGSPLSFSGVDGALYAHGGAYSTFIKRNDVVVVGTVREESLVAGVVGILCSVVEVLTAFLKDFTEDILRDHFSTVYQILQEMLDYGYPLHGYLHELEGLVAKPTLEHKVRQMLETSPAASTVRGSSSLLSGYNRLAPWRSPNAQHTHSEILFDVVEQIDCLMSSDGGVAHAAVRGAIVVNSRLNGMPEVTVRLSRPDVLQDVGVHYCVRAGRYETDRSFSFIPPDGRFTLCQYTVEPWGCESTGMGHPSLVPFYVTPNLVLHAEGRDGTFTCMVGWRGGGAPLHGPSEVGLLSIRLRFPRGTSGITIDTCTRGTTRTTHKSDVVVWKLDALGRTPPSLSGSFTFDPSPLQDEEKQVDTSEGSRQVGAAVTQKGISAEVEFEISNYCVSPVAIEHVQVSHPHSVTSPKFFKGVKYVTRAGDFIIRSS